MKPFHAFSSGWRAGRAFYSPFIQYSQCLHTGAVCFNDQPDAIKIPQRVNRSPTDILRALASTIQQDSTAAHYKYHDDPYLMPMSNIGKRTFALAKESGRKAAQWIRDEHRNLFQHQVADPPIEAFLPRPVYDENSEVDENTLKQAIKSVTVSDAITIYQLLEKKNQTISQATKQSLLEMLCFYNCDDAMPEDLIEEKWFRQGSKGRERRRKTWKDGGLAETVFHSLESPDEASAYCTLLRGMTRYCQVDRAWQLYEEMQQKGLPLDVETYNSLIRVASFLREGHDLRWKLVEELLTAMCKQNLSPTVGTLNAVLDAISTMSSHRNSKTFALRTLSEFRHLNIEPSLATYYYLLIIFCRERGPTSTILGEILNHIEGKAFTVCDPKDTFFFVTAMDVCRHHLQDKEMAHRVNRLLHTANNYDLIGDSYKESIYYRHYFALLCTTEPLEVFMEFYNKLVPNIYIPEPGVMEEVLKAIDLNGAMEHYPRIWSDMVVFDHVERESLIVGILNGMVKNQPPELSPLAKQFASVAWEVWNVLEETKEGRYRQIGWTAAMLGDVMTLCLRGGEFDRACQVLQKLDKNQHTIVGLPSVESLQLFLDICIIHNKPNQAIACIKYCADAGFPEAGRLAQQLKAALQLDAGHISRLVSIVGNEAILKEDAQKQSARS